MPVNKESIRPIAVAIIKRKDKNEVLVSPGYDEIKDASFYRLLGGGIDFGEKAEDCLRREIKEELNLELKNVQILTISENIFTYQGFPGHEICFVFRAEFVDESAYLKEDFEILDSDREGKAIWLELNQDNVKQVMPPGLGLEDFLLE